MLLVTRSDLGWPASAAPDQATTQGVKIHYEGTPVSSDLLSDHNKCIQEWKDIRASHLANKAENYSDVAYNYAACPHGYLLEGRGIGKRTGANGNQTLNRAHYAIVGLVGDSGLTDPTPEMLSALRDGIELLQANGAGGEIKGHRDGYATSCPGEPLYNWVQAGAPRPNSQPTPVPAPGPSTPARYKTTIAGLEYGYGANGDQVTEVGNALVAKGFGSHYSEGPGPNWTDADTLNYQDYQKSLGYSDNEADGVPGPTSLQQLLGHIPGTQAVYSPPSFPQGLRPNSSNPSAKQLQQALKDTQWLDNDVTLNDNYGPKTQAAVAGFNAKHGLNNAGVSYDPAIGPHGWDLLFTLAYA